MSLRSVLDLAPGSGVYDEHFQHGGGLIWIATA